MPDKDPADFSLAKRMLQGLSSKDDEPAASSSPKDEAPEEGSSGGDSLGRLLDAFKRAPGKISAIEPEGYGYLIRVGGGGDPLKRGARGDNVHALETALRKAGVPNVPDLGRFDGGLEAAVKHFQAKHGLKETGVFDAEAFEKLHSDLGLDQQEDEVAPVATTSPLRSQAEANILPPTGNPYLDQLVPGAVRGMHESGFPASVLLAMAILESQWGERLLARDHHNVFALTGEGPAGSVIMQETPGGGLAPSGDGTAYRCYTDPADSVADFAAMFAGAAEYQGIMSHRGQPNSFARALSGSYSSNPQYGSLVQRLLGQFDLYRFDRIAPPPPSDW